MSIGFCCLLGKRSGGGSSQTGVGGGVNGCGNGCGDSLFQGSWLERKREAPSGNRRRMWGGGGRVDF